MPQHLDLRHRAQAVLPHIERHRYRGSAGDHRMASFLGSPSRAGDRDLHHLSERGPHSSDPILETHARLRSMWWTRDSRTFDRRHPSRRPSVIRDRRLIGGPGDPGRAPAPATDLGHSHCSMSEWTRMPAMAFGQQSGPPASAKRVRELLDLLKEAGHSISRRTRAHGLYAASGGEKVLSTKRTRSSPNCWTQNPTGVSPSPPRRGGSPPRGRC